MTGMSQVSDGGPGPCLLRVVTPKGRTVGLATAEWASRRGAVLVASARPVSGVLLLEPDRPGGRRLPFRAASCVALAGGGYLLAGVFLTPVSDGEARALAGA